MIHANTHIVFHRISSSYAFSSFYSSPPFPFYFRLLPLLHLPFFSTSFFPLFLFLFQLSEIVSLGISAMGERDMQEILKTVIGTIRYTFKCFVWWLNLHFMCCVCCVALYYVVFWNGIITSVLKSPYVFVSWTALTTTLSFSHNALLSLSLPPSPPLSLTLIPSTPLPPTSSNTHTYISDTMTKTLETVCCPPSLPLSPHSKCNFNSEPLKGKQSIMRTMDLSIPTFHQPQCKLIKVSTYIDWYLCILITACHRVSLFLADCLTVCMHVCQSIYQYLCLCISSCICLCLLLCLSACLSACLSMHLSDSLCKSQHIRHISLAISIHHTSLNATSCSSSSNLSGVGGLKSATGRRGPSVGWGKPVVSVTAPALSPSAVYLGELVW